MPTVESLLVDAGHLPVADRIQLIDALWDTLPEEALPPLSEEWTAEIQRRSAEHDTGVVAAFSWQQVKAEALGRLAAKTLHASH